MPFMTRLPKKRGITQVEEDKSLILRQNVGNPPEVTSDENSYAEIDDSRTIPDVPINKGYPPPLTKLIVPDHSLYLAGREWSGREIVILSARLKYLVTRRRG